MKISASEPNSVVKVGTPLTDSLKYWGVMLFLFFVCSIVGGISAYFWIGNESKEKERPKVEIERPKELIEDDNRKDDSVLNQAQKPSNTLEKIDLIDVSKEDFDEGKKQYEKAFSKLATIDKIQDPNQGLETVEQSIIELEASRELMLFVNPESKYYSISRDYISLAEQHTQTANGWKKAFIERSLNSNLSRQANLNAKRRFPDLSNKSKNSFITAMRNQSVALTFDDGPTREYTPQILAILNKNNVKATFFVVGNRVRENCDILRAIYQSGHEIGNHTDTHPYLTKIDKNQQIREIQNLQSSVDQCLGFQYPINWFRAPYGDQNSELLDVVHQLGFNSAQWVVDTHDWKKTTSFSDMQNTVMEYKNPGVILMHDGSMTNSNFQHPNENPSRQNTVNALQPIINHLKSRGLNIVKMSEAIP